MNPTLLIVTYELGIPVETFLERVPEAARTIAEAPGLVWETWSFERDAGSGTSAYLFRASAEDLVQGPAIAALRDGTASRVHVRITPVERSLSALTHADRVIEPERSSRAA